MSNGGEAENDKAGISLVEVMTAFPFWPLSVACTAIDAAHREQGRHLPQPGALPLPAIIPAERETMTLARVQPIP